MVNVMFFRHKSSQFLAGRDPNSGLGVIQVSQDLVVTVKHCLRWDMRIASGVSAADQRNGISFAERYSARRVDTILSLKTRNIDMLDIIFCQQINERRFVKRIRCLFSEHPFLGAFIQIRMETQSGIAFH